MKNMQVVSLEAVYTHTGNLINKLNKKICKDSNSLKIF